MYFPNEFKKDLGFIEYNSNLKDLLLLQFGKLAGEIVTDGEIEKKEKDLLLLDLPNV